MKLHLGCGNVYLKDYVNIDVQKSNTIVVTESMKDSDLVENHTTTFDKYYKFDFGSIESDVNLVDACFDVSNLMDFKYFMNGKLADEIIAVQILEHFSEVKVKEILKFWSSFLVEDGKMIISVPDILGTCELLLNSKSQKDLDWASRLIYGSQKDDWAFHKSSFTKLKLNSLLKKVGIVDIDWLDNFHCYPAIVARGIKK